MSLIPTDIGPATREDLSACAAFITRRHLFEPNRLHDSRRTEAERVAARTDWLKKQYDDPRVHICVAKHAETGEPLGFITWLEPALPLKQSVPTGYEATASSDVVAAPSATTTGSSKDLATTDPEKDHEMIQLVTADKKAKETRFFGQQPFWILVQLFVTPKIRRGGVGSALLSHFLQTIKKQDPSPKIGFSSSPSAMPLYQKQGFTVVDWFEFTVDDVDEQGQPFVFKNRWPYMTNFYEGNEEQVAKAARRVPWTGSEELDPELQH